MNGDGGGFALAIDNFQRESGVADAVVLAVHQGDGSPFLYLSAVHLKGVNRVVFDGSGIHAGHGVVTIDVESPVGAVHIVVGSVAIDGIDHQAIVTILTGHDVQGSQGCAHGLLVGVDGADNHLVQMVNHQLEGLFTLAIGCAILQQDGLVVFVPNNFGGGGFLCFRGNDASQAQQHGNAQKHRCQFFHVAFSLL